MLFQAYRYLIYWLNCYQLYSLQSPLLFNLYKNCFKKHYTEKDIEELRLTLSRDETEIDIEDFGAGSRYASSAKRKISSIVKNGISNPKHSALLKSLTEYFNCRNIIELGTSIGLNTAYLSKTGTVQNVYSFEGDRSLLNIAEGNLRKLNLYNKVELIEGNIDLTLAQFLENSAIPFDFVFFDANHTKTATLNYYKLLKPKLDAKCVLVFDDINWSREMREAWDIIKQDSFCTTSVETFQFGIVFTDRELPKQNWMLSY